MNLVTYSLYRQSVVVTPANGAWQRADTARSDGAMVVAPPEAQAGTARSVQIRKVPGCPATLVMKLSTSVKTHVPRAVSTPVQFDCPPQQMRSASGKGVGVCDEPVREMDQTT
jgi:hypothetical protein